MKRCQRSRGRVGFRVDLMNTESFHQGTLVSFNSHEGGGLVTHATNERRTRREYVNEEDRISTPMNTCANIPLSSLDSMDIKLGVFNMFSGL
jgi:hypothetical protein